MLRTAGSERVRRRVNATLLDLVDSLGLDLLNPTPADLAELEALGDARKPRRERQRGARLPRAVPAIEGLERSGVRVDALVLGEVSRPTIEAWSARRPEIGGRRDPRAALYVGLAAIDGVPADELAVLFPDLDVLIVTGRWTGRRAATRTGSTIVAHAPAEGQYLGSIRRLTDGSIEEDWLSLFDPSLTREEVQERVADTHRAVRSIQEAEARARGKVRRDLRWAGGESCASCHEDAAKVWKATGHAHAMATLVRAERDFDEECLGCHVTAWKDGYVDPLATPELADVQCEACHGPGASHVAAPQDAPMRATEPGLCVECHTAENSPDFDLERYRERIRHWRR